MEKVAAVQTKNRAHHITRTGRWVSRGGALLALVTGGRQAANKRSSCATRRAARELRARNVSVRVARVRGDLDGVASAQQARRRLRGGQDGRRDQTGDLREVKEGSKAKFASRNVVFAIVTARENAMERV